MEINRHIEQSKVLGSLSDGAQQIAAGLLNGVPEILYESDIHKYSSDLESGIPEFQRYVDELVEAGIYERTTISEYIQQLMNKSDTSNNPALWEEADIAAEYMLYADTHPDIAEGLDKLIYLPSPSFGGPSIPQEHIEEEVEENIQITYPANILALSTYLTAYSWTLKIAHDIGDQLNIPDSTTTPIGMVVGLTLGLIAAGKVKDMLENID